MDEEQEINDLEAEICGNVANLSSAYSNLMEIDAEIMDPTEKKMYKRMRRKIFKALYHYCECLPEVKPESNEI